MGGEDRMDRELRDEVVEPLPADACTETLDGRLERFLQRLRSSVPLAQHARAVMLLGKVRKVEIACESAGDLFCAVERPRRHELLGAAFVSPVVTSANDQVAQGLDVFEKAGPIVGHDLAEQVTEEADVAPEGSWNLLPRGVASLRARWGQASGSRVGKLTAYSSESTRASSEASMMLLEHPTVVQRLRPLPDSMSTRVVAAVPAP